MNKCILAFCMTLGAFSFTHAQSLPPILLDSTKIICDISPWKLIMVDHFDGNSLNRNLWYSFNSNNNGQDDNWCEARIGYPGNFSIHKDENVIVKDGRLSLQVKQEKISWQCPNCDVSKCTPGFGDKPVHRNYSSGYISSKTVFNTAKIEARLKMPTFQHSWATCWTWHTTSVNEIDFVESGGGTDGYSWPYVGNRPSNNYNLHAWAPQNNIHNLPEDMHISRSYPGQSWWLWLTNSKRKHQMNEWHTYTCEWDTVAISFYLDEVKVNTFWKYYQEGKVPYFNGDKWIDYTIKIGRPCALEAGKYYVLDGFPYNNKSRSKLIFSLGITTPEKVLSQDGVLGEMEIDYIKIYQRHPEKDGFQEIEDYQPTTLIDPPSKNQILDGVKITWIWVTDSFKNNRIYGISDAYNLRGEAERDSISIHWDMELVVVDKDDQILYPIGKFQSEGLFMLSPIFKLKEGEKIKVFSKVNHYSKDNHLEQKGMFTSDAFTNKDALFWGSIDKFAIQIPSFKELDEHSQKIIAHYQISEEETKDPLFIKELIDRVKVEQLEPFIDWEDIQYIEGDRVINWK